MIMGVYNDDEVEEKDDKKGVVRKTHTKGTLR